MVTCSWVHYKQVPTLQINEKADLVTRKQVGRYVSDRHSIYFGFAIQSRRTLVKVSSFTPGASEGPVELKWGGQLSCSIQIPTYLAYTHFSKYLELKLLNSITTYFCLSNKYNHPNYLPTQVGTKIPMLLKSRPHRPSNQATAKFLKAKRYSQ